MTIAEWIAAHPGCYLMRTIAQGRTLYWWLINERTGKWESRWPLHD